MGDDIGHHDQRGSHVHHDKPQPLYVHRKLLNPGDLIAWAHEQGFKHTVGSHDLHVTVCFSKKPMRWSAMEKIPGKLRVLPTSSGRRVRRLGDKGAVVLMFRARMLKYRWSEFIDNGASWDWDGYRPHVTITYNAEGMSLSGIEPYTGELYFGPEVFGPIVDDWEDKITEVADTLGVF